MEECTVIIAATEANSVLNGAFMQSFGFVAGMASMIGLYAVVKIVMWRRGKKS